MRVAYLVAGAGGMLCGSCLRDNRVAARLIARGRDVELIPLYTPIRTDEIDVSRRRVLYGGVNVYLRQKSRLFRLLPRAFTRLLDHPVLLRRVMRLAGSVRPSDLGELTVSVLRGDSGRQRQELRALVHDLRARKPDLVQLPNLMFLGLAPQLRESLGAKVLCSLTGEDFFLDQLPQPHRSEAFDWIRRWSGEVDGYVASTDSYASHAAEHFDLPRNRIHVVRMGVKVDDAGPPADPPPEPFTIGYLARVCPEKGLADCAAAFVRLRKTGRNCRLRVAGYLAEADRGYLERVRADLGDHAGADAFEFVGEVDRAGKLEFLRSLHVLSVPAVHPEAKGLYVLEAMASGVPVVLPRRGSFPELVEATGGGLLYDPGKTEGLADGIARLMDDGELRDKLARRGRSVVHESFNEDVMAEQTWTLYERTVRRKVD